MNTFDVDHCYEDVDLVIEWGGEEDDLNMQKVMSVDINVGSQFFSIPVDHPIVDLLIREYEEDMLRDAEGVFEDLRPGLVRGSNGY